MKKYLALLVAIFATALVAKAGIEVGQPTILSDGGEPYYVLVPFTNTENNYQGSLEGKTIEDAQGKKHVGKFTLSLSRIDALKSAQVTESDKQDPNFWETAFKNMTKQMSGHEMVLDDNTDIIVIDNVALVSGLFKNYYELVTVTLNYDGNCTIPSDLFSNNNSSTSQGANFSTLNSNIGGEITIGDNVFPSGGYIGNLSIKCTSESIAKKWNDYKAANSTKNYNYKVYLNGVEYNETSAVGEVTAEGAKLAGKCYNAAGQQVNAGSNGLLIQNGKKVIK